MTVICLDTEYDARYTDLGVARLACMTYSFGPDQPAAIVGPAKAVDLWLGWVNDPSVTFLGHSLYHDIAVLAQETYLRTEKKHCVPGQGWAWEQAHRLYDPIFNPSFPGDELRASLRVVDTEIRQRLTQVRFGPHKASVRLGDLAKMLFGEDRSDSKDVPDEAQALLRAAVPYSDWPDDVLAKTPWRVLFGYLLERYGENPSDWPQDAIDYALDDARLPWRVLEWQRKRWGSSRIPDDTRQTIASWGLHVLSIPGWKADRPRAQAIRERYRNVIGHCDRTLIDAGILHVPGAVETAKRAKLQALIFDAFAGDPPITKSKRDVEFIDEGAKREATATDTKTVMSAVKKLSVRALTLVDVHHNGGLLSLPQLLADSGAPALNAHLLRNEAKSAAAKLLKANGLTPEQSPLAPPEYASLVALADACLPTLVAAGLVEVSYPRTIKKREVADRVFAVLGEEAPLSKKKAEEFPCPTIEQRREFCSTDAKAVRAAVIESGGKLRLPADAVAKADEGAEAFDAWLADSGAAELNAYAVRSKAAKTISSFLDYLDTDNYIRTSYQTLVDTGRTSSRNPNIQQLPRDYDKPAHLHIRGCIVPPLGECFLVADYSQLELCSLAHVLNKLVRHYAGTKQRAFVEDMLQREISDTYESTLAAAINADQDCHVRMAATLRDRGETYEECNALYSWADAKKSKEFYTALGVSKSATFDEIETAYRSTVEPKAKVTHAYEVLRDLSARARYDAPLTADEKQIIDDRQLSKPINFGYPGGLGPAKFVDYAAGYGVTIDLATAKQTKRAYEKAWIEMRLYFWHIGQMCKDGTTTLTQLYSKRQRGDCFFTQAANGFFQSLAADGAKEALRRIIRAAYRLPSSPLFGTRPSGFVHDEFLVNCKIDQAPRALPALEHEMVQGMMAWIPDVKIKAPGKILYERWGK